MKKILGIFCITLLLGSCSSFLEEYSQDLSKVESYTDLDEVLLGEAYLPVGRIWIANSMLRVENKYFQTAHYMSDELTVFSWDNKGDNGGVQDEMFGWHTWQQDVGLNAEGSSRNAEDKDWNKAYHCINICNMVIDAINEQHAANEEQKLEKSRIKGEAHFLRALYYFTLVNMYGKPYSPENLSAPSIPIKLSPVVEDKEYTTNTVGETYNQILKDLDEADTCLINTAIKNRPYRADITAVYLLKSRTYLYMQNWKKAYEYAQKVLAKNDNLLDLNTLSSGSGDVLTKSSPETIFSMGGHLLASSIYKQRKFSYGKWVACPVYTISDDLISAFREGENDLRMQYYIMKDIVGGGWNFSGYMNAWVFKKVAGWENLGYKEVSDQFLFRTAEAYLNAAEAAAYMGEEGIARTLLKALRDKRLINSTMPTESGESLVTLIREERQCELCLEGHRWYDLRRYLVCEKYPYSKTITHYYTRFDYNGPLYTKRYMLETNDPAYTLALPKEVLDFQNNLGTNHRPARTSTDYTPEEPDDVTPPVQE